VKVVRFRLDDPPFTGRTGRGVRVAVVDSGVTVGHPHVGAVSESVRVAAAADESAPTIRTDDALDRMGHGTAVAAAIREKAPGVELVSVKVFNRALSTSADLLARGITWAADRGARLVNLSLGTANAERAEVLLAAVAHAASRGAIVVSARESGGVAWLPGSLAGVAGVDVDWECERDVLEVALTEAGIASFRASAYPRPIPGVSRERNLSGISFAVANVTGFLARVLEAQTTLRTVTEVAGLLRPHE
jgi:subtilisin family serine protease